MKIELTYDETTSMYCAIKLYLNCSNAENIETLTELAEQIKGAYRIDIDIID